MSHYSQDSYTAVLISCLLIAGCGGEGNAKLLCSLEGEAYFVEIDSWNGHRIRRVESGDRLCPKPSPTATSGCTNETHSHREKS
jgi:hypothetical protein